MPFWSVWLCALGKAIWQEAPHAIASVIPFGENLYRIGERFYENLSKEQKPDERRAALEQLVPQPAEAIAAAAREVAAVVAPDAPPEIQLRLARTLELAPAVARCSLRRAEDPSGRSVPAALRFDQKGALLPFVPPGPPRFQCGESPPTLNGWQLVERLGAGGFAEVWKVCHPDDNHLIAAEGTLARTFSARKSGFVLVASTSSACHRPYLSGLLVHACSGGRKTVKGVVRV